MGSEVKLFSVSKVSADNMILIILSPKRRFLAFKFTSFGCVSAFTILIIISLDFSSKTAEEYNLFCPVTALPFSVILSKSVPLLFENNF